MFLVNQTSMSHGLSNDDATQRHKICGYNEFEITEDEPLWKKYLGQVRQFLNAL